MERIVIPAVRAKKDKQSDYKIISSSSHKYIHKNFLKLFGFYECKAYEVEDGFLLSDDSFANREIAYKIAKANNQLIEDNNFILKENNVKYDDA